MVKSIIAVENSQHFASLEETPSQNPFLHQYLPYEAPLFVASDHLTIQQQAEQQALMDWQRNIHRIKIGTTTVATLRDGKPFEDINDLYGFLSEHLLVAFDEEQKLPYLHQAIIHLHQGGLLHSAGIGISQITLRGLNFPTPSFEFNITLYPTTKGIGIEENLKLKQIGLPDGSCLDINDTNRDQVFFNVQHHALLELTTAAEVQVEARPVHSHIELSPEAISKLALQSLITSPSPKEDTASETGSWFSTLFQLPLPSFSASLSSSETKIPSTLIEREQRWLEAFETFIQNQNQLRVAQNSSIQSDYRLSLKYQQMISEISPILLNIQEQKKPVEPTLNEIQTLIEKFVQLKKQISRNLYHPADANFFKEQLKNYLEHLQSHQQKLMAFIYPLQQSPSSISPDIETYLTALNEKIASCNLLIETVMDPNTHLAKIDLTSQVSTLKQLTDQKISLDRRFMQACDTQTGEQSQALNLVSQYETLSQHIQRRRNRHEELLPLLDQLKTEFATLSAFKSYPTYSEQREAITQKFKAYEAQQLPIVPHEHDTSTPPDFIQRIKGQETNAHELLQGSQALAEEVKMFYDEISQQLREVKTLYDEYRAPLDFVDETLLHNPAEYEAISDAVSQLTQLIKEQVFNHLREYSHPKKPFHLMSNWNCHNIPQSKKFQTELKATRDLPQLYIALKSEYDLTKETVYNPEGSYRLSLKNALDKVVPYILPSQLPQLNEQAAIQTLQNEISSLAI